MPWTVVIPLKPPSIGKTRLGSDARLARAIALDTLEAVSRANQVSRLIVVTADEALAREAETYGEVIVETEPAGIAAAIATGLAHISRETPRAALLGDLPGLGPRDLDLALILAAGFDRGFVRDAEGTGSTLVTARGGVAFEERFGPGSAEAHRAAGLVELDVPAVSTVRQDVDDLDQLEALAIRGVGPRTTSLLGLGRR